MARLLGLVVGVSAPLVPGLSRLPAIDKDVEFYRALLASSDECQVLVDHRASRNAVHEAIFRWNALLEPGDQFVFAFSGHGVQRPTDHPHEPDHRAEALALHDGLYPDKTIRSVLHGFRPGVFVYAIIDSCDAAGASFLAPPPPMSAEVHRRYPAIPGSTCLTLAAVPEGHTARQSNSGGLLVDCLRRAWDDGSFTGTWRDLWNQTAAFAAHGYYRHPYPEAWIAGPDQSESILDQPVRTTRESPARSRRIED